MKKLSKNHSNSIHGSIGPFALVGLAIGAGIVGGALVGGGVAAYRYFRSKAAS